MKNGPDDFELLYKRRLDKYPDTIGVGSFAYENVSFLSQIKLPDGTVVSLPTMAFEAVADAKTEREAVENIFDYMRKKLKHDTGDHEDYCKPFQAVHGHPILSRDGMDSLRRRGRQPVLQRRSHRTGPRSGA